jgi:Pro-kumamolisin, activation domain
MVRGAARVWPFVLLMACGSSTQPLSPSRDAATNTIATNPDASETSPARDATANDAAEESAEALEEADIPDAPPVDASASDSEDASPEDATAEDAAPSKDAAAKDAEADANGTPPAFDPSVCLPPDAGAPDADVADADDASCSPTPAASLPQVLSGEVAQVTTQCGVDGGPPPMVGTVPGSTMLHLSIGLPLRNEQQAEYCAELMSDPSSPIFRHFLTNSQYEEMYEPTECDYQSVIDWAQARGLTVDGTYDNRLLLDVTASAATIGTVFHVTLLYCTRPDGSQFYAPNQDPSFDLNVTISGILGFDDCQVVTSI